MTRTAMSDEIAITGIGVVLPRCDAVDTLWNHLRHGESQLRFEPDPADERHTIAMGRITDFAPERHLGRVPRRYYDRYDREVQIYLASVLAAVGHAALDLRRVAPSRIGIFDGCSRPMFGAWHDKRRHEFLTSPGATYSRADLLLTPGLAAGVAASVLRASGSLYTFNNTCCSGSVAIGHAFRELQHGVVDVALATGHEAALFAPIFAMYREAELLSLEDDDPRRAIQPYGASRGNAFGEGAVTLVLERRAHAESRGAFCYAVLKSYRYGNNGSHPTTPDLRGERAARLIHEALEEAQLSPEDIGFVVGHGNGVRLSDDAEAQVMHRAFGELRQAVPLISNKPIYGHTMGASSALNAAAAVLMLHHQYIVPTLNAEGSRGHHIMARGESRACKAGIAMSSGLGGNNTVLLVQRVA
jgi:3-oxoacyl-[acyl-carrier-protein] synthase II